MWPIRYNNFRFSWLLWFHALIPATLKSHLPRSMLLFECINHIWKYRTQKADHFVSASIPAFNMCVCICVCVRVCVCVCVYVYMHMYMYMYIWGCIYQSHVWCQYFTPLGIGYYTALDLAKRNARVIVAGRNEVKIGNAVDSIREASGNPDVVPRILDVSLMKSVRSFAEEFRNSEQRLDILINNAGMAGKWRRPYPGLGKYSRWHCLKNMMTSSNGNIFRVTGPLCGEFTGDR